MSRPDVRVPRSVDFPWHVEINRLDVPHPDKHFMYEAKSAADEVPRLALLFGMERRKALPQIHHQCSRDHEGETVSDNHLTCCLGVECRKCPYLAAIDEVECEDEQRDVIKAWTCATHIIIKGGDEAREGYILTVDDRLYWENVLASLTGDYSP